MPAVPQYGLSPQTPAPTRWQVPQGYAPAHLAAGVKPQPAPATARGVSPTTTAARFVLPSPEALGVSTSLSAPPLAPKAPVDWNQLQARVERLGVLQYEKERLPGGVRVRLVLPTRDPSRGQPVEAHADTEAAALVMALETGEAWAQKR